MDNAGFQNVSVANQQSQSQEFSQNPKRSKRFFFFILFLLIVGGLFFFGRSKISGIMHKLSSSPTPTVTPSSTPEPTQVEDTPTPEETTTPQETDTPTPKPTQNPVDSATGLDRSTLTVEIQNGSGTVGVASKASDILKNLGYHVTAIGNADNFDYDNTTIMVRDTKSDFLSLLQKDLSGSYTVGSTSAALSASSSADALVIVGKE